MPQEPVLKISLADYSTMQRRNLVLVAALVSGLFLAGVLTQVETGLWDMPKPSNSERCENTLNTHADVLEDGNTTREIPEICLREPRMKQFRKADENDKVRITDGEWEVLRVDESSNR